MKRIAVIGQSGIIPVDVYTLAEEVGKEIAKSGSILLSGGGSGVMEAASKGAKEAGGLVIGILAGDEINVANDYIDIPITTGLAFDYRSIILVHSADVLIMIRGGNGTLGELSAAYMNKKPVVVMDHSGGWASKVKDVSVEGCYLDERKTVELLYATSAKEAVHLALQVNQTPLCKEKNTGVIGD
ncbi:TIGR00725 family protein [Bacillus kexueae]|uniref:TIGR00725 family protein n=1 Tax=Aeribacillus kexueae TaxID=2078952 RepID=UPI001FAF12A5|nr:TIGR00725 family protein [Bacillus kexueae]